MFHEEICSPKDLPVSSLNSMVLNQRNAFRSVICIALGFTIGYIMLYPKFVSDQQHVTATRVEISAREASSHWEDTHQDKGHHKSDSYGRPDERISTRHDHHSDETHDTHDQSEDHKRQSQSDDQPPPRHISPDSRASGKHGPADDTIRAKFDPPGIAPCGEVCSYVGVVVKEDSKFYPELRKDINCENIMRRMAFKNHPVVNPPPEKPPAELMDEFTMYGGMPISKYLYLTARSEETEETTAELMYDLIAKLHNGEDINTYLKGRCVQDTLKNYTDAFKGLRAVVIGTVDPWLEAILMAYGAKHITTLEYKELSYELPQLEAYTPYDYAEKYLRGETEQFDFGATFSSVEHAGLGRYTDPLNPYGDLEAMAQVWCMIKPGGYFALGVPVSNDDQPSIVWNAHRIYGTKRFQHMTANWEVIHKMRCENRHAFLIIRKPIDAQS